MGLLRKSFTSNIKTITTLAVSRIAILKNQTKARASYARSDVAQLLKLGYHDHALLRVDQWIAEQNMLDVFVMIENYCNLLRERAEVLEMNKECPDELKEVTSSLIFASSRCGKFPELHKIQEILTSTFGKEFADHAVELRRNNRVNSKMIQKISPRRLAMEIKMEALKQIAMEIGVTLHLEQDPINVDKLNVDRRQDELEARKCSNVDDLKHKENTKDDPQNIIQDKDLSDRNKERKRSKDTAAAALEAMESKSFGIVVSKHSNHRVSLGKVHVHPMVSSSSKQEDEVISKGNHGTDLKELEGRETIKQLAMEKESHLSQSSRDDKSKTTSGNAEVVSKEHMEEDTDRQGNMLGELGSHKSFLMDNNDHKNQPGAATANEHLSEERAHPSSHDIRWKPQRSHADPTVYPMVRRPVKETTDRTNFSKQTHMHHEHLDWKKMSVRTR
ncbi:Vacuolar protein sorting-associated protein Ist1 [Sesbania bispinosa]|nr:Vacuolar protein sorting-associated protein Ist1 [Sesbania bispinosa]